MTDELESEVRELEARVDALNRARMTAFDRLDELEDTVDELLAIVETTPEQVAYEELTHDKKVYKIRKTLLRQAVETNGYAAMDYSEINALFDGHPSRGHCYDLLEDAAKMDGFGTKSKPQKKITVKSDAVKDKSLFHAVTTTEGQNPA